MNKSSDYEPLYTVTPTIERMIGEISEAVGRIAGNKSTEQDLLLRRSHRIRTIHGSLAIEGNSLSEEQVTAILEGKRVVAPPREILEVRNAIKAYDLVEKWKPRDENDLLAAHDMMMGGLVDSQRRYRHGGVGVVGEEGVIHVAPPAKRVPVLMGDLFGWLNREKRHPLVSVR